MSKVTHTIRIETINGVRQITVDHSHDHTDTQNRRLKNQIEWKAESSTVKTFQIDFKNSPFTVKSGQPLTLTGGVSPSTPRTDIDPTAATIDHKYTVSVVPSDGGSTPSPDDPHIKVVDMNPTDGGDLETLKSVGGDVIGAVLDTLKTQFPAHEPRAGGFFFPYGIQSVSVTVLGVTVTVSGENPPPTTAGLPKA